MNVEVVADLGENPRGSLVYALDLIEAANKVGYGAVQFGIPSLKEGVGLQERDYLIIDEHCKAHGMEWSATVGDVESAEFLVEFNPRWVRIEKGKAYFVELLKYCAVNFQEVRVSTEMLGWNGIKQLHKFLYNPPHIFDTGGVIEIGQELPAKRVGVIFHAGSEAQTYMGGCNLRVIERLKAVMGSERVGIGYSGNDRSDFSGAIAVSYGASVIERVFKAGEPLYSQDGTMNLDPESAKTHIQGIREAEKLIGHSSIRERSKVVPT